VNELAATQGIGFVNYVSEESKEVWALMKMELRSREKAWS
jgi:hypothetical protein